MSLIMIQHPDRTKRGAVVRALSTKRPWSLSRLYSNSPQIYLKTRGGKLSRPRAFSLFAVCWTVLWYLSTFSFSVFPLIFALLHPSPSCHLANYASLEVNLDLMLRLDFSDARTKTSRGRKATGVGRQLVPDILVTGKQSRSV